MKKIFHATTVILSFILFGSAHLYSQNFSGQIFDNKTKQPISYVNVGIPNKKLATVSDHNGNFSIQLNDNYNKDSLKISMIGYKSILMKVQDAKDQYGNISAKFYMDEINYELNEVVIRPIQYKTKIVGNRHTGNRIHFFVSGDSTATNSEVGTLIKLKKKPAFIDNINFGVGQNDFDSIVLRINIYTKKNENILKHPIYATVKKDVKTVTVDTKKYNIEVDDDFIIAFETLEIIQAMNEKGKITGKKFTLSAGLFGSESLHRVNIYDEWEKVPIGVVGFNATIRYEDNGNWFTNIFNN